jgi:hypothetical protein
MVPGDEGSGVQGRREGDREPGNHGERRRHRRFRLELSVNVHLGGRPEPVTVEIVDIAARGVRFRSPAGASPVSTVTDGRAGGAGPPGVQILGVQILDEASFGFVSREQHICVAHGRVLRAAQSRDEAAAPDEFVVSVERANAAFHSFVASLAA